MTSTLARIFPLLALCAIVACSGGGSSNPTPLQPTTAPTSGAFSTSPPVTPPPGAPVDDWTTFAHDQFRTGYQPQTTGLSTANAGSIALRWHTSLPGETMSASPLVANGVVYVAGHLGTVEALNAASGAVMWKTSAGGQVDMTPTLADGILFVGVHKVPGAFLALNAATGALLWSTTLGGGDRSEPVVAGGSVFVGDADGDSPDCHQSGVHAFAETTGAPLWSWYVNSVPNDGGAQWSPISFDGSHLVFGTGNTCLHTPATSNAIVALDTSGNLVWDYNAATPTVDDDIGGGETIVDGYVVALDKNGILYCLSTAGHLAWSKRIGFLGGYGGVATPATDGATIVVSAGYQSDPTMHAIPGGKLEAFDRSGNAKWSVTTEHNIFGAAAISNGVVLSPLDESLVALDLATGKTLWSYAMSSEAYASPAIVPSGIYAVDNSGDIYAFTLPAAGASSSHARVAP